MLFVLQIIKQSQLESYLLIGVQNTDVIIFILKYLLSFQSVFIILYIYFLNGHSAQFLNN